MAMSLPHQIGAISGTPIASENGGVPGETSQSAATVSASAVWKTPATNLRVSVAKPVDAERVSPLPSPPLSPVRGGAMRADLSVACQAYATETSLENVYSSSANAGNKGTGVPVFVMMPLDSVKMDNTVNRRKAMNASLQALKSAGVEGIMMDVWWGLVERDSPGEYNFGGYAELLEMAKKHGLKVQAVMSFHQCGGNVGDSCTYVTFNFNSISPLFLVVVEYSGIFCIGS